MDKIMAHINNCLASGRPADSRWLLLNGRAVAILLLAICTPLLAHAQKAGEEVKIPPPENVVLETKDKVPIKCTWYAGTLGKKSVPIIMLHGWGGVRGDYSAVAKYLQEKGHAVIVPDLRGHGDSREMRQGGELKEIKRDRMTKNEVVSTLNDIEAVKKFLVKKNNLGELNIEMLCVVAADSSCILAMHWALQDWSWPQLIGKKQGQDVKALVLISPKRSFKGMSTALAERKPLFSGKGGPFTLSVMVMVGERDRDSLKDANALYKSIERSRKLPRDLSREERVRRKDSFLITRDVEIQGPKLLDPAIVTDRLDQQIAGFIHYRLEVKADEFAWTNRSSQ